MPDFKGMNVRGLSRTIAATVDRNIQMRKNEIICRERWRDPGKEPSCGIGEMLGVTRLDRSRDGTAEVILCLYYASVSQGTPQDIPADGAADAEAASSFEAPELRCSWLQFEPAIRARLRGCETNGTAGGTRRRRCCIPTERPQRYTGGAIRQDALKVVPRCFQRGPLPSVMSR